MKFPGLTYSPEALAAFAEEHNIILVIIYGSRADGTANETSDWDVAVMPMHKTHPDKIKILVELDKTFEVEIDSCVIDSNSDPLHRWEVFRGGKPLYEDRAGRFDEEFVNAWKVFCDTEKFRRIEKEIIDEF